MGLSKGARDRALRGIITGKLWLGLATARQGKGFVEVRDSGYLRQPVTFSDPVHQSDRSYVTNRDTVTFPPFAVDSPELRYWFVMDSPNGDGELVATGTIDPRMMLDKAGNQYTLAEAGGTKETLTPLYPRQLAGEEPRMAPGDIVLYIKEEDA